MSLNEEERMALTAYRIQKSHDTMEYVHGNVRLGYWPVVANRLYYAAYYAVTALLIKDGLSAQTHHGVIHMFNLHYIKTGKLDSKYGRLYGRLFTLRQTGDYDDMYDVDEEDVAPLIVHTEELVTILSEMVSQ
ncbi:MAG: HEPN domain-containing protein [Bacteroidales bacterium]|nr:HEPN domain-containing protein [Bacteroidales bacterium]MBP5613952.1 HEPN domain-containing protein [Bacteroidales bacterium]